MVRIDLCMMRIFYPPIVGILENQLSQVFAPANNLSTEFGNTCSDGQAG